MCSTALQKYCGETKKHMTALTEQELDVVFESFTQSHEVKSFDDYFAAASEPKVTVTQEAEPAAQPGAAARPDCPARAAARRAAGGPAEAGRGSRSPTAARATRPRPQSGDGRQRGDRQKRPPVTAATETAADRSERPAARTARPASRTATARRTASAATARMTAASSLPPSRTARAAQQLARAAQQQPKAAPQGQPGQETTVRHREGPHCGHARLARGAGKNTMKSMTAWLPRR